MHYLSLFTDHLTSYHGLELWITRSCLAISLCIIGPTVILIILDLLLWCFRAGQGPSSELIRRSKSGIDLLHQRARRRSRSNSESSTAGSDTGIKMTMKPKETQKLAEVVTSQMPDQSNISEPAMQTTSDAATPLANKSVRDDHSVEKELEIPGTKDESLPAADTNGAVQIARQSEMPSIDTASTSTELDTTSSLQLEVHLKQNPLNEDPEIISLSSRSYDTKETMDDDDLQLPTTALHTEPDASTISALSSEDVTLERPTATTHDSDTREDSQEHSIEKRANAASSHDGHHDYVEPTAIQRSLSVQSSGVHGPSPADVQKASVPEQALDETLVVEAQVISAASPKIQEESKTIGNEFPSSDSEGVNSLAPSNWTRSHKPTPSTSSVLEDLHLGRVLE